MSSAANADKKVNIEAKALKHVGLVLILVTAALVIYSIYNAEDRYKEAAKQAGVIGGGVAGGAVGAWICGSA